MSQVDTERATALRTNPWYNTVQYDGSLSPITPVPPNQYEIQSNLEAVFTDFPITPGIAHSYDRVHVTDGPTTQRDENGNIQIVQERQVYIRSAVNGQWFMIPLKVYTTDLPTDTVWDEDEEEGA